MLDLPGLDELLRALHRRELSLVEVETPTASPFASSLLFDYVATYMYEGDTPNAERRAAALSLDRDLLRELLGQEELRELIDPAALDQVEADLQHRSERTRADSRDALADVLRRVGDLTDAEVADRVLAGLDAAAMLAELERERRAVRMRVAGEERWIAADDAGLYRDALRRRAAERAARGVHRRRRGAARAARRPLRTHPRPVHDRRGPRALRRRSRRARCARSSATGELVRGELRPGGTEREWCDPEVLRRLRRASLAVLRKEIEAADQRALARFLPSWQGVDRHPAGGAGVDRLREVLVPLQGLALPADVWERDVLPRRVGAYSPTWMDQLCASGEVVWVGAGALGPQQRPGRPLLPRRRRGDRPARRCKAEPPAEPEHDALRERLRAAPCFFTDLLAELSIAPEELQEALWDLVWAGEATNDAFAPLRAPRLTLARAQRERDRRAARAGASRSRRAGAQAQVQGRWSLDEPLFRDAPEPGRAAAHAGRAAARALRDRHPRAGAGRGRPGRLLDPLRRARRSWRRSASAGAATSSRVWAARSSRCPARSSACARSATTTTHRRSCSPRPTRPSPTGRRCRGPSATTRRAARSASAGRLRRARRRRAGALRRARRQGASSRWSTPTTRACARRSRRWPRFVTGGRTLKLSLERIDGEPVVGSAGSRCWSSSASAPGRAS